MSKKPKINKTSYSLRKPRVKNASTQDIMFVLKNKGKLTQKEIATKTGKSIHWVRKVLSNSNETTPRVWAILPPYNEKSFNKVMKRIKYEGDCWIVKKNEIVVNEIAYTLRRVFYYWTKNVDIRGLYLLPICKNPTCINPEHYYTSKYPNINTGIDAGKKPKGSLEGYLMDTELEISNQAEKKGSGAESI